MAFTIKNLSLPTLNKTDKRNPDLSNYVVALDIGTEFVKALVAKLDGDRLEIVGAGRAHQDPGDMQSGAIADIAGVVHNCEVALAAAEEQSGIRAKKVVIGIAGELVKGTTNTIRYKRPQADKELDEAEMNYIIDKVHERARDRAQKQVSLETGAEEVEVRLVNSAIVSIYIDGYKVTNPIGFQGKDVAIQIYTAYAPMVHIGALERAANELDLELMAVAAEPFAVSRSVLGTDASSTLTAILVDVGGGTTDIAVVNDGGVQGTKMFGIGGRSFTRTIMGDMEVSYEDAEKLKLNLGHEQIKPSVTAQLEASIDRTLEVWKSGVEIALEEFDKLDHLPRRILLCGGGASLKPLVESLGDDWYKALPFTRQPTVELIEPGEVEGITDSTGQVNDHTYITAMGLLRVGYDTMVGAGGDTIRDRLNRILRI